MSHIYRFFALKGGDGWSLDSDEVRHLKKSLRLGLGDAIELFDGKGSTARAEISGVPPGGVDLNILSEQTESAPTAPLEIALGALRPGHVDDLLPALVEVGVTEVLIFHQKDTAKGRIAPKALQRWRRIAVAACKQSKRAWVPDVTIHKDLVACLTDFEAKHVDPKGQGVFLDPNGASTLLGVPLEASRPVRVFVGGEKGLSAEEIDLLRSAGMTAVSLGDNILRATTAITVGAAVLNLRMREQEIEVL